MACGSYDDDPVVEPTSSTEPPDPAAEGGVRGGGRVPDVGTGAVEVEPLQDGVAGGPVLAAADTRGRAPAGGARGRGGCELPATLRRGGADLS